MSDSADTGSGKPGGTQTDTPAAGEPKFTQEDLNKLLAKERSIAERKITKAAEDAAAAAVQAFRDEHGIDDSALEAVGGGGLAKDLRVARSEKTKAERRAEAAEKEAAELRSKVHGTVAKSVVLSAAAGKAVDPEDVWLHLRDRVRLDDQLGVEILDGETGEPSELTPQQLVEGLLAAKPHLALPTAPAIGGAGSRPGLSGPTQAPADGEPDLMTPAGRQAFYAKHAEVFAKRK